MNERRHLPPELIVFTIGVGIVFFLYGAFGPVSGWSLPWAFLGGGLMGVGFRALSRLEFRHSDETAETYTQPGQNTLDYCEGCGCNHRRLWMNWVDTDTYRCVVCCKPSTGAAKAAMEEFERRWAS